MSITLIARTQTRTGPVIPFVCPRCQKEVSADSTESIERTSLFGLVPILKFRNTSVRCPARGVGFNLALTIQRLAALPAEARGSLIVYKPSTTAKILAISACLLFWVPILGMLLAATALYFGRGTKGWPKALSWLSFLVGSAITICVLIAMFL